MCIRLKICDKGEVHWDQGNAQPVTVEGLPEKGKIGLLHTLTYTSKSTVRVG